MSGAHAVIAPSSLDRTVQCPGSVAMELAYPETEQSPDAADGEASHWGGSELLQGRLIDVGDRAPNGVVLTQEMVEGADLYYADVHNTLARFQRTTTSGACEVALDIHAISPHCWGTPDYRNWVNPGRLTLMLWDYKFGHRQVEAFGNYQLAAYAIGCVTQMGVDPSLVDVVARIVQPRSYHRDGPVREWRLPATDLEPYRARAAAAAAEALGPSPSTRVGPECRDCRARHACPTLQRAAMEACDTAGLAQPLELDSDALGVELRYLKRAQALLDARVSGLEEQAHALALRGKSIRHWRVEFGTGRTRWTIPDADVIAMGAMLDVKLAKPPAAITPSQARALGMNPEVLDAVSITPKGGATLVADDGSKARQVFGGNR